MQIQNIPNFSIKNKKYNPQFKKAYPVVHWLSETNGSYAPVVSLELTEKLQRILVGYLNNSSRLKLNLATKEAVSYIREKDFDYKKSNIVRSYYNLKGGFNKLKNQFSPFVYLITGDDVYNFNKEFAKPLGKAKANAMKSGGKLKSAELEIARMDYKLGGSSIVNDVNKKMYDNGKECALHTKFEIVRGKRSGKIKGFNLVAIKFCPNKGPENPFVRTGYLREQDL